MRKFFIAYFLVVATALYAESTADKSSRGKNPVNMNDRNVKALSEFLSKTIQKAR